MGAEPAFKLHPSDPQTPALSLPPLPDVDTPGPQVHVIVTGPQQDWELQATGPGMAGQAGGEWGGGKGCEEEGSRDSLGL